MYVHEKRNNAYTYICTELEIAACHLPFSEQNMNMADQNLVGSAIRLTTKLRAESLITAITLKCQFVLPISRFSDKDSFVLCMYVYVHTYIRTYIISDG